jgi:myo-inositol catabolism protein IolC
MHFVELTFAPVLLPLEAERENLRSMLEAHSPETTASTSSSSPGSFNHTHAAHPLSAGASHSNPAAATGVTATTRPCVLKGVGFDQPLFILPFDHRGSFQEKLFGITGRAPTPEETQEIAGYKHVIYQGFEKAIQAGVPRHKAGILVDEQFGSQILLDAKKAGFMTSSPAEKSGQDEFDFEYGPDFGAHIRKFNPTFVKVLVRYNPEGDATGNERQSTRLKQLSDFCHENGFKFMFELLVPATAAQLQHVGGDSHRFDLELRPSLMVKAMQQLQNFGVEPDLWKLEGIESIEDSKRVATQARAGGRPQVGVIVLGRGENAEKVKTWLTTAAQVPGLIGFAVGRTIFWEPLKQMKAGKISAAQAAEQIARTYHSFCDLWEQASSQRAAH